MVSFIEEGIWYPYSLYHNHYTAQYVDVPSQNQIASWLWVCSFIEVVLIILGRSFVVDLPWTHRHRGPIVAVHGVCCDLVLVLSILAWSSHCVVVVTVIVLT